MRATERGSVGMVLAALLLFAALLAATGCSRQKDEPAPPGSPPPAAAPAAATGPEASPPAPVQDVEEPLPPLEYESALGADHADVARTLSEFASLLAAADERSEARALAEAFGW